MTTITITRSQNGDYKRVLCKGHSGYADRGSDIVCSAISILVINTINSLEAFTDAQMKVECDDEKGLIDCQFTGKMEGGGALLLDSMVLGLKTVATQYGSKFLKLNFKEV